jgi:ferredoxin-NADP reductase
MDVAEGTMAFHFEKPAGFAFKAGQNADWTLINPPETDAESNKRTFSFVTSPEYEVIGFASRMRDTAFKRNLKNMSEGTEIELDGPYGDMFLHSDTTKPAIFLAGGIGITPFMSMSWDAAEKKLPHKICLFYSNRRPEDAPFLKELEDIEKENPNFKLVATMTDIANSKQSWAGETGYITKEMISKYVPDFMHAIFYLAGPPVMVAAMRKMINDAGILDDYIKAEDFAGY